MEQHWSKDYIEHLRTVHFTLIFLCTAGVIIAFAPGKPELSPARQQLDQIRTLAANWDPNFLQSSVKEDTGIIFFPSGIGVWPQGVEEISIGDEKKLILQFEPRKPTSWVTLRRPSALSSRANCEQDPAPGHFVSPRLIQDIFVAPENIQQFKDLWDTLSDGAVMHTARWTRKIFLQEVTGGNFKWPRASSFTLGESRPGAQAVDLTIQCLLPRFRQPIQAVDSEVNTTYQFSGIFLHSGTYYLVHLPADLQDKPVDGLTLLFRNQSQIWHSGTFDESFRELSEALKHENVGSLTWQKAVTVLADQEKRTPSESFEAFGMKLPASLSAYGALIMILGVQWYLWAQLYEFRRKLKAGEEVADAAWVSLYTSLPARSLAITSMFLLPVFAVAALGFRGAHSHILEFFSWPVSALGLSLSIGLALATGLATPRTPTPKQSAKAASTTS